MATTATQIRRRGAALARLALGLLVSTSVGAEAKVYVEAQPRATVAGGYDDNVPLNGAGGDGFGQITPGLKLDVFGPHDLRVGLDCEAGFARLMHPEWFSGPRSSSLAFNGDCGIGYRQRFSTRSTVRSRIAATYAQDPFSISALHLLLRPGQQQVFRGKFDLAYARSLSPRTQFEVAVKNELLTFGVGDPGNGYIVAPQATLSRWSTAETQWSLSAREQIFGKLGAQPTDNFNGTAGGIDGLGHAVLGGVLHRITAETTLTAQLGALALRDTAEHAYMPIGSLDLASQGRVMGVDLLLLHDLVLGATHTGPLVGDLAELGFTGKFGDLAAHLRGGVYRNALPQEQLTLGAVGYSSELGIDWSMTRAWTLGVAGLRDARLGDAAYGVQANRDVVQVRLTWQRPKDY